MSRTPIHEIAAAILRKGGQAMTAQQVYDCVVRENLYEFDAKDPVNVVRKQMRRHSSNVRGNDGAQPKSFRMRENGLFELDE